MIMSEKSNVKYSTLQRTEFVGARVQSAWTVPEPPGDELALLGLGVHVSAGHV